MIQQALEFLRLYDEATCQAARPSYSHRVDDPENFNWCTVPKHGQDAVLFAGVALLAACLFSGQFFALAVLLAGGLVQTLAFPINFGPFGNALALWLGVEPPDLLLYVFLPPILLDSAARIDFFVFKKMIVHVISFAFLMVMASTAILSPMLLYVFGLSNLGWRWEHAAMFSAIIASTDAVAVSAVLKSAGAPVQLQVMMEGESLFNDATAIVLFQVFFNQLKQQESQTPDMWHQLLNLAQKITWLSIGGVGVGLAMSLLTRLMLKFIHRRGHKGPEQLTLTIAMAYLTYYFGQLAGVSGVIAVVVLGLGGSATGKWSMSAHIVESGTFDVFWDTISFAVNGIVFFYAGCSSVNFFWRSSQEIYEDEGTLHALATLWRLPLLYLAVLGVRGLCILLLNPLFKLAGTAMSWSEIIFTTVGGLRGAISLILVQQVVTESAPGQEDQKVTAELAMWTSGVVVCTLLINAPLLPLVLHWTGLARISPVKGRLRAKAVRSLRRFTEHAVVDLEHDTGEMMRGGDWTAVRQFVDLADRLDSFAPPSKKFDGDDAKPPDEGRGVLQRALDRTLGWAGDVAALLGRSVGRSYEAFQGDAHDARSPLLAHRGPVDAIEEGANEGHDEELGLPTGGSPLEVGPVEHSSGAASMPPHVHAGQPAKSGAAARRAHFGAETKVGAGEGSGGRKGGAIPGGTAESGGGAGLQGGHTEGGSSGRAGPGLPERPMDTAAAAEQALMGVGEDVGAAGGQVLKTSECDKEMAARHSGFGQFEVPFLTSRAGLKGSAQPDPPPAEVARRGSSDSRRTSAEVRRTSATGTFAAPSTAVLPPAPTASQARSAAADAQASQGTVRPVSPWAAHADQGSTVEERKFDTVPQPIMTPKMLRPGSPGEGQIGKPRMRWVMMHAQHLQRLRPGAPRRAAHGSAAQPGGTHATATRSLQQPSRRGAAPRNAVSRRYQSDASAMRRAMSGPLLALPISISDDEGTSGKDAPGEAASENEDDDIDGHDPGDDPELLIETRVRLVTGLKRYLHTKHGEGLLSAASVQVLDHACDSAIDQADQPLNLWAMVEREVCGKLNVRLLSMCLFWLRRLAISGSGWHPRALWAIIRPPTVQLAELLGSGLSCVMLQAIECAVEFWLALEWSPQAQWLLEASESGPLQEEVKRQSAEVWQFILDREIEAPARFQAIQTQRAAAAILRQQVAFVEELYAVGVIDAVERKALLAPIEKRERMLQRRGAVWRTPRVMDVLRNLPFLRELPGHFLDSLLARGTMLKFDRGQVVWAPLSASEPRASANGDRALGASGSVVPSDAGGVGSIFVVMAGLVKSSFLTMGGGSQEYYLGTGSVFGLLSALVGEDLPGAGPCLAVGNALRQGPVVYEFPQPLVASIRRGADDGDAILQQLQLDLFRVAALYVVERLRGEVLTSAAAHFQALAIVQARHRTLCRLSRRAPPSQTHAQVWKNAGSSERARNIMASEFKRALEAPTLDAFDDGRKAGDAPDDNAPDGGSAGGNGAAAPAGGNGHEGGADAQDGGGLDLERALAGLGCAPGPSDRQVMASLDPQRIWQKIRSHAATALATLREDLRDAELVTLAPGAPYDQETSLVLLKGTLLVTGHAHTVPVPDAGSAASGILPSTVTTSPPSGHLTAGAAQDIGRTAGGRAAGGKGEPVGGRWEVGVEHRGPSVVLWLWEAVNGGGEVVLRPQPIRFTAGPEGAVLVACRPVTDSDSDATLSEASTHAGSDILAGLQPLAGEPARARPLPDCGSTEADATAPAPAPGAGSSRRMRVVSIAPRG
ncbi:hypothetical protein WJX81_000451 [Elliptochloris bilobata]|uniref:Cation/H+ exchanger transmembrane domain-containing protein n=1 Tax=Elliptochloris bilobata TaxID=381761 RepID=A0AAW1S4Q4_9CHLO